MRIIKIEGRNELDKKNLNRLVSEMICLESGARVVDSKLEPLPLPHELFPLIKIPPITSDGQPYFTHYRPTVGIVFYSSFIGFKIDNFIVYVSELFTKFGDDHLLNHCVATTASTMLKQKNQSFVSKKIIIGTQKSIKKIQSKLPPTRSLQWSIIGDKLTIPSSCSINAAFTWVFMPASASINGFETLSEINANVASIFYDISGICDIPDNSQVYSLTRKSFLLGDDLPSIIYELPSAIKINCGFLIDTTRDKITYVGNIFNDHQSNIDVAEEPWNPKKIKCNGSYMSGGSDVRNYQCVNCDSPLSGKVIVINSVDIDQRILPCNLLCNSKKSKVFDENMNVYNTLLCIYCWNRSNVANCIIDHLSANVTCMRMPFTQSETAAACMDYKSLSMILSGIPSIIKGVENAFIVTFPNGTRIIITDCSLGKYPALTYPEIAAEKINVFENLRLKLV